MPQHIPALWFLPRNSFVTYYLPVISYAEAFSRPAMFHLQPPSLALPPLSNNADYIALSGV
jgi:hypothetical protein